jgi:hypothetical protein
VMHCLLPIALNPSLTVSITERCGVLRFVLIIISGVEKSAFV